MTPDKKNDQPRGIIHVDMDAFYASVEIMDDPGLEGKAVVVGGTPEGRGVVAAASYESRKFGVHSAMSAARAKRLCPHAVFIHPRMARYAELSRQIRDIFLQYTPLVEPLSLDEAFLDVSGSRALFGPPVDIGRAIKRRILEEVGLVASVGIAPNKYLAKLASDLEKPDGFVVIRQEEAQERLAPLPVGRLWGIGKVSQKKLKGLGIETIGDLLRMPMGALESQFGVHARRLKGLGQGLDDRRVISNWDAKSLSAETTFATDISDAEELRDIVDSLAVKVARRVRKGGYLAYTIQLKARYADFSTVTRAHTVGEATAQTAVIRDAARLLLEEKLDRNGRALRLLGVGVSHIVRVEETQALLFEDDESRRNRAVDDVMDSLQDRFGTNVIHRGKGRRRTGWD